MKKLISKIIISAMTLLFMACSGGDTESSSAINNLSVTSNTISLNESRDVMSVDFTVKNDYDKSVGVEFYDFKMAVEPCSIKKITSIPETVTFNSKENQKSLQTIIEFNSACTPTSLKLQGSTKLSLDGKDNIVKYSSPTIDINSSKDDSSDGDDKEEDKKDYSNYKFYNIPKDIEVVTPDKEYTFKIQLIDLNKIGVVGEVISILAYDSNYGDIYQMSTATDPNGFAHFTFKSPKSLKGIDGKTLQLSIVAGVGSSMLSANLNISFNSSSTGGGEETDTTLPTVVIPSELKSIKLTSNSQNIEIPIKVFKDISPYTTGKVSVELPSKVLSGSDVGSFKAFTVDLNEQGIAIFNYTGPANLKALIDAGDKNSLFKFYHSENSSNENRKNVNVTYDPSADTYIPIDYELAVTTQNSDFSMGIPTLQKTFSVVLKDTKGNIIKDSDVNITKVSVRTENALIAEIFDTKSRTLVNSLVLNSVNNSPFIIKSKKLSGIVPLKIVVDFIDINKEAKTLSTIVNVRVMSGPPSAISISYVSTGQDKERAKYEEKLAISVTDEYGNRVNTKPHISLGAIVGYAVDGKESQSGTNAKGNPISIEKGEDRGTPATKRLYYDKFDIEQGKANGHLDTEDDDNPHTSKFYDNIPTDVFKYVNAEGDNTDKLVVFGAGKNYDAMGKWDFDRVDGDYNTLKLKDDYFGKINRENLYYAVGHNYYQDQCMGDGREWIGSTDADTYQLDDEGTVIVSYKYDYHLTGKDALIWVNLNGYQADTKKNTRIGEVTKHTLRGTGLIHEPSGGYSLEKNSITTVGFNIWHKNAPEQYRNGHFGWSPASGSSCGYSVVDSSNYYDARTCNNGGSTVGSSYLKIKIWSSPEDGCSFNIAKIIVSDEF